MQVAKRGPYTPSGILVPHLKAWRIVRGGLTQIQLGTRAGVHPTTVSNGEQGGRISLASALKIASALGVSVTDLQQTNPLDTVQQEEEQES